MKKIVILFIFLGIGFPIHSEEKLAEGAIHTGTLRVVVKNVKKMTGTLRVALFNKKEGFLKHPFKVQKKEVTSEKMEAEFTNLNFGDYAVTVFQDLNDNKVLDMTFFVPAEPWGLSNNVTPMFGPPDFDSTKFNINHPQKTIEILLK
jgi:uncharacterized protein (DUF2141 family)